MWLRTNERITAVFGIEKRVLPPRFSDQIARSSPSVLPVMAARAAATFRSKAAISSVFDGSAPGGDGTAGRSISDLVSVSVPQVGRLARCVASAPSENDLGRHV